MFWTDALLPGLVRLSPAPGRGLRGITRFDPLSGASRQAILTAEGGFHVALADGPRERRLWIEGKRLPKPGTPLRALVSLDADLDTQVMALRRLRALVADPTAPPDVTPYQERMLLRALQALDAHLDGASVRATAEALFGAERVAADWCRGGPLRDQTRYLIRRGRQLMAGGYRELLSGHPPRVAP